MLALHATSSWAVIKEHLNDTIGKQLVGLEQVQAALPHFLAEIDCPHNSSEWQLYYLDQFLEHTAKAQQQQVLARPTSCRLRVIELDVQHLVWFMRRCW